MPATATKPKPGRVAQYLARHIDASEKSQYQIAQECGFDRPNIISMFKVGLTKLPMNRIGLMAESLSVDPNELFRLCMDEYMPEVLELADAMYKREQMTEGERDVIKRLRLHTKGKGFRPNRAVLDAVDDIGKMITGK